MKRVVDWKIDDTIQSAVELSRYFPEFELIVYNNASDLPENIRNQMIHQGATPERVKAWVDDDQTLNKVYLIAANTPPSEVAATLGHEIIGHRGLRAVFGEQFNDLLDLVYRDHAAEIDSYAERYLRNPENNVDNQRYLTEEFLADCANLSEKPSWWKEFIAKIRAWLRQFKPGLQFTNRDIEGVISMAARRIRKNSVVKKNLTTDGAEGIRFALDEENDLDITQAFPVNTPNTALLYLDALNGKDLKNRETGDIAQINSVQRRKILSQKAINKSIANGFSFEDHLLAAANIEQLYENAVFITVNPDLKNEDDNVYIKRYIAPIVFAEKENRVADVLITQKISLDKDSARIYSLEVEEVIPEVKIRGVVRPGPSSPSEGQSLTHRNYPADVINKLQVKHEKIKSFLEKNLKKDGLRFSVSEDGTDFNGKERKVTDNSNFKRWFADSKVVDDNGEPLVVYHGTNWDILEEPAGEAAFSDKYRGVGSGDNGFFGRGFYFTFGNGKASEGEAGYYGKNVFKFYLSIQNPFYFSETLLGWNGKRVLGDEVHSVEIVNAVNLFPELLKDFTLDTYDKNGDFSGVITLDKYARMFKKVYDEKKFSVRQTSNPDEIVVECDPVPRTQDGHTWTEYKFSQRIYKPRGETDMQLLFTHLYLGNNGFPDGRNFKVEIPYGLFREFYGEPEFRSWLENNGYDGVMQSKHGDEVVAFKPTQIKSATDNIGTFDSSNPDIRFLLAEFTPEERRDITLILKPYVGFALNHTDLDYVQYLADRGVNVSEKDAHAFAVTAMRENIDEANQRNAEKRKAAAAAARERRDQWIYANTPLYREAVEFAGTKDFKIKPSGKFRGEDFSGSFISPEFVKYSRSKKKDDSKLDSAAGVNSNEFAAALARKWGRDELQLEQEIIDYFRDLKKTDLFRDYSDFRKNQILEDKEADRLAYEEALKIQQSRVEEEVIHILEHGLPITEEYVKENPEVYKELHRQILKEEPPEKPRKKDIETLNAAVNNETVDAAAFAAAYKSAREAAIAVNAVFFPAAVVNACNRRYITLQKLIAEKIMPVIIDSQLKEQIPYDPVVFPISFFHDELESLWQWSGPLHWHPGFEIATAETGILDYQVGEKHITLNPGDSIFVNGNILHGIRQISGDTADPMPNVVFSGNLIAPEGSQIYQKYIAPLQQCDDLPFIVFAGSDKSLQNIKDFILNIYHCFRNQPPCYEMMIQRDVSQIFEYIYLNINTFPRHKSNRIQLINQIRLQKMLDFIYTHYQEQISLKDLAQAANVSRSEVGRCFNAFMNCSPIEILIRHRLQIACKMLAEKIYTVEEISNLCGFNSVNYFRRQFNAKYGVSPSKYCSLGK